VPETGEQSVSAFEPLDSDQATILVTRLLDDADDAKSVALVALVKRLAHDPEGWHREHIAHVAAQQAFTLSESFETDVETFIQRAVNG
jgi:hypothetical protein